MADRASVWNLLTEFTQSESLRKHALAVGACMRAYARKFATDEELWSVVGLLHDFDYEKYPSLDDHPYRGNEILKERAYSEEIRRTIMSHADYTGVTRDTPMEKALFACDELAGFITARAASTLLGAQDGGWLRRYLGHPPTVFMLEDLDLTSLQSHNNGAWTGGESVRTRRELRR